MVALGQGQVGQERLHQLPQTATTKERESCSCSMMFVSCLFPRLVLVLGHILLDNGVLLLRPLPKDVTPHPHLIAPHADGALEIRTHAHTQLKLSLLPPQLFRDLIPRIPQAHKILILILRRRLVAPRNGTNGHEAKEVEMRTVFNNMFAQTRCIGGLDARLCLLAARVDLHHDAQLVGVFVLVEQRAAPLFQLIGLLLAVDAADAPQVRYLLGQLLALVRLQAADHVPADGAREEPGFLEELLDVVFAKVGLLRGGWLVQGEDVVCRLQLGHGDEADLGGAVSFWGAEHGGGWAVATFCPLLLAALMRDVMVAMFSDSCFARWGLMCISSAMVQVRVQQAVCDAGTCRAWRRQFRSRCQPYMWGLQ